MKHRGLLLFGLPASLVVLMIWAAVSSRPPERATTPAPTRTKAVSTSGATEDVVPTAEAPRTDVAGPPDEMPKVARAMDLSNVRMLARTLSEAAALEDVDRVRSMKGALRRYGALARPILREELGEQTNPKVLAALTEAMNDAR